MRRSVDDLAALHDLQIGLGQPAVVPRAECLRRHGIGAASGKGDRKPPYRPFALRQVAKSVRVCSSVAG